MNSAVFGVAQALPSDDQEVGNDENAASGPNELLHSPRATIRTFLEAMSQNPPQTDMGVLCMDISEIPSAKAPELAIFLYRCLNRIEYIDLNDPRVPSIDDLRRAGEDAVTSWTLFPRDLTEPPPAGAVRDGWERLDQAEIAEKQQRFRLIEELVPEARIVLRRMRSGEWKFSAQTVAGIEELWDQIRTLQPVDAFAGEEYRTLAERIEAQWPEPLVEGRFIGVRYWQWITLFLVILAGIILDFLVRGILTVLAIRVIQRHEGRAKPESIRRTVRPFGLTAAALLWLWAIGVLGLPVDAMKVLVPAVKLFAMLAIVWAAFRLTDLSSEYFAYKASKTKTKFDDVLVPLIRKAVKVFIFVFGIIYIAGAFNIPLAPLLTGLGIGGAGFAFAAKDTLEHFFGSVTVIADRPFEVGDWVQINDVEGIVEELGFRSTRVRTFHNSLVTIPNGNLVRAVVDNYGKRKYRRWSMHLAVTYETAPDRIEAFCEGIREIIRVHPYTRKDYYQVWLHRFGAHSLDILVYMFFEAPNWDTELRERHRFALDIIRLADQLGVSFAFPTQTLHMHSHDDDAPHTPAKPPGVDESEQAASRGRETVQKVTANADWRRGRPGPHVVDPGREHTAPVDDQTQIESKLGGDAG